MISPSTPMQRGIQMYWPNARVTRSAMLVLPLPGGPEQEQSAAGVDGRPQSAKHRLVDQQVGERALQIGGCRVLGRQRLGRDAGDIVFQHDRCGAEIGAVIGQAAGSLVPGCRSVDRRSRSSAPRPCERSTVRLSIAASICSMSKNGSLN